MTAITLTDEEKVWIRENPISQDLIKRMEADTNIRAEAVDYQPGEEVIPNRFRVLYKIGSGQRGHAYAGVYAHFTENKLEEVVRKCLPYASRKHYLELLRREEKDKSENLNKFATYLDDMLGPHIARLKEEIKHTRPIHNYAELRSLAESPDYEKFVLKLLSNKMMKLEPQSKEQLLKEGLLLSKAHHPSIPKFIDFVNTDKGIAYLTEYLDGQTLQDLIDPSETWWRNNEQGEPVRDFLKPEVVLAIMSQFYGTLAHMHRRNIQYSDIQQGNILLGEDRIHVIDFGFTEEITPGKKTLDDFGGDEHFIPPEIAECLEEDKNDPLNYVVKEGKDIPFYLRSPVWSGGIMAHVLIANGRNEAIRYPFDGHPFSSLAARIRTQQHTDPRHYHGKKSEYTDAEIDSLVHKPLQKDYQKRPLASAEERTLQRLFEERMKRTGRGDMSEEDVLQEFGETRRKMRSVSYVMPGVAQTPKRIFKGPTSKGSKKKA